MRDLVEHRGGWKANFFLFALLALDDRVGENNNGDDLPASEQYRKLERERERERCRRTRDLHGLEEGTI